MSWINKDTEIYCSFAKTAGNTGCQMMNTAFYYYGLNKIYKSFSVDNIEDAVNAVRTLNIKGFAITMPYKVEVLDYVDEMTDEVIQIGSANTIVNTDGVLKAYNTDCYSSHVVLSRFSQYENVFILGDGGFSKAVQYSAQKVFNNVVLITRKNWDDLFSVQRGVIFNCTPVRNIQPQGETVFIDCGVDTSFGQELALLQASKQFKLYTGRDFPMDLMKGGQLNDWRNK